MNRRNQYDQRNDYRRRHAQRSYGDYDAGDSDHRGFENRGRERNRSNSFGNSSSQNQWNQDYNENRANHDDRYDRSERYSSGPYRNDAYRTHLDWNTSDYRGQNHRSFPTGDRRNIRSNQNSWSSLSDSSYGERSGSDEDSYGWSPYDRDRDFDRDNYGMSDYSSSYAGSGTFPAFGSPRLHYSETRMQSQGSTYGRDQSEDDEDMGFGDRVRQFFGLTPKGYTRSDERIYEDVCEYLARDGRFDPSEIEVKVENGEVTLEGSIDSRQAKWRAEECVDKVFGVKEVHNSLRVNRSPSTSSTSRQQQQIGNRSSSTRIKAAKS